MFKVLREMKIDWKSFLIRYRKIFGVAFDDNERKKYFGTTTMYKIIGYVSPYGVIGYSVSSISSLDKSNTEPQWSAVIYS